MGIQLPFEFAYQTAQGADDFIISDANEAAVKWLDRYPNWGAPGFILTGPQGSGKTHLAKIWQAKSAAVYLDSEAAVKQQLEDGGDANVIIDNADKLVASAQEAFFHLYNRAVANDKKIMFCAEVNLPVWRVTLADLQSRLASLPQAQLQQPDDILLAGLFAKQLADRGVILKADLVDYALPRLPRSAAEVVDVAVALDHYALENSKPVNLSLLREFFGQLHG